MASERTRARDLVVLVFSRFEDLVYVGLGLMLAYSAAALLVMGAAATWKSFGAGAPMQAILELLDRSLLILMFVELLYTVQVSFRAHALKPEPFLVVGLIAATREPSSPGSSIRTGRWCRRSARRCRARSTSTPASG